MNAYLSINVAMARKKYKVGYPVCPRAWRKYTYPRALDFLAIPYK